MTAPSMQPERNKAKKNHPHKKPLILDGDPGTTVSVNLTWSTSGVTVTFPADAAASSASWNGVNMTAVAGSSTAYTSARLQASNSLTATIAGSVYSGSNIARDAGSGTISR